MTFFLDTSALLALFDSTDAHHQWAVGEIEKLRADGPAIVCDIVYCEASVGMQSTEELDEALRALGIERIAESDTALFRAGRAFKEYKHVNRGPKNGVMPDFLIGAVAEDNGTALLTSNHRDFQKYFPNVVVIHP